MQQAENRVDALLGDDYESEADGIIDFSEGNPFGTF